MTTSRKLTRNDVAALMGVSQSTVIRREREGVLHAELVGGVHVYDETEVRRTITTSRHRTAIATLGGASGEVAALVFTELDSGANEIEIVRRHAIAPVIVKGLATQYREFRSEVVISDEELASLREQLRLERATLHSPPTPDGPGCLVCGRTPRVRACAACLMNAHVERRTVDGRDEVRYVVESAEEKWFLADWMPTLESSDREPP